MVAVGMLTKDIPVYCSTALAELVSLPKLFDRSIGSLFFEFQPYR